MRLSATKTGAANQYRGFGKQLWDLAGNRPSLDLNFANNKSLVDDTTGQNLVTFTRASSGTYVDSDGLIKTATTNHGLWSEDLTNPVWAKDAGVSASIDATQGTPYQNAQVSKIIFNASNLSIQQSHTYDGAARTVSAWVKGTAGQTIRFFPKGGVSPLDHTFSGSWERISVSAVPGAGAGSFGFSTFGGVTARTVYVTGVQLEQSSTVGEYIPTTSTINSAPRFDHNPTTGESLGLLVEEQRTNSIRNNTMVGAVAGTPGALPTNWVLGGGGLGTLSRQVVGIGSIGSLSYIDIRYFGTTSTTGFILAFEPQTQVAALTGQSWASSFYVALVGGSLTNIDQLRHDIVERTSVGGSVNQNFSDDFKSTLTSSLARSTYVVTLSGGATTAVVQPSIEFKFASGVAIDITLRIGMPQLEQGAFATSVIPTAGTAVTRAADVASITGSNFGVSRTNLLLRSEEFGTTWTTTRASVSTNILAAPDGTLTAEKLVEDTTAANTHLIQQTSSVVSGSTYTLSVFAKAAERSEINIQLATGFPTASHRVNLNTGETINTSGSPLAASVQALSNGWYRISVTQTANLTTSVSLSNIYISVNGTTVYSGDGTSGIYLWGAQLETGSTATAYIPTTTAAVTVVESSWYNQTEGTVFVGFGPYGNGGPTRNPGLIQIDDGSTTNTIRMFCGATVSPVLSVLHSSVTQAYINSGALTPSAASKISTAYKANDFARAVNASNLDTDSSGTVPTLNRMLIGTGTAGVMQLSGTIRRLTYWPTRLSDTTLQAITT